MKEESNSLHLQAFILVWPGSGHTKHTRAGYSRTFPQGLGDILPVELAVFQHQKLLLRVHGFGV
jgi:hypothetical protein